jgi:hypothetical protein
VSALALTDARILVHDHDFSGDTNQVSLNAEADDHDVTTFGSARETRFRSRIIGLKSVEMSVSGFWDETPDAVAWSSLGVADRVTTISPTGEAGDVAYLFRSGVFSYEQLGEVGEPAPFSISAMGTSRDGLIRGRLVAAGDVDAVGPAGVAVQLPAVAAGQYLYAALHVLGTPGTTLTAVLESDDADTFASATTRFTFGPLIAAGGTWGVRVAGGITDTYHRLRVSAVTGTFTIAAAIGIGS